MVRGRGGLSEWHGAAAQRRPDNNIILDPDPRRGALNAAGLSQRAKNIAASTAKTACKQRAASEIICRQHSLPSQCSESPCRNQEKVNLYSKLENEPKVDTAVTFGGEYECTVPLPYRHIRVESTRSDARVELAAAVPAVTPLPPSLARLRIMWVSSGNVSRHKVYPPPPPALHSLAFTFAQLIVGAGFTTIMETCQW
ncbi:hypothetical protein J6590_024482 [Homalodisca vitripennis]|nr:hypothetical protein J6590_024482 [Homalodisca vitripennis]